MRTTSRTPHYRECMAKIAAALKLIASWFIARINTSSCSECFKELDLIRIYCMVGKR